MARIPLTPQGPEVRPQWGANLPWGEGDTPFIPIFHMIRDRKLGLSCLIEYEYPGTGTPIEEVKKCMACARRALAS